MKNTVGRTWFSFFLRPSGVDLEAPVVRKKRGCRPPHRRQQLSIVWPDQGGEESGESQAGKERKGGNRAEQGKG